MSLKLIKNIKNMFGYSSALIILLLIIVRPNTVEISFLEFIILMFIPLGTTDLVWNQWLYDGLMEDENATYSKLGFSFRSFQIFGMLLALGLFSLMIIVTVEYLLFDSYRLL